MGGVISQSPENHRRDLPSFSGTLVGLNVRGSIVKGDSSLEHDHDSIKDETDDSDHKASQQNVGKRQAGAVLVLIPNVLAKPFR